MVALKWFHFTKIPNLFWAIMSGSGVILLTPAIPLTLIQGEFLAALGCTIIVVPFYYLLLSMYFEHLLERRFGLREDEVLYLDRWSPIWGFNFNRYCLSRREILETKLSAPGNLDEKIIRRMRRLLRLHTALMWAFYVDCAVLVGLVVVLMFTGVPA